MKKAVKESASWRTTALYLPPAKLTTDNAAMIAAAGYFRVLKKDFAKENKTMEETKLNTIYVPTPQEQKDRARVYRHIATVVGYGN